MAKKIFWRIQYLIKPERLDVRAVGFRMLLRFCMFILHVSILGPQVEALECMES